MAPDNLLGDMAQKAKAYKASITILEPYLTSYLWIQLPFGLFSALAIGHEFFIEGISWGWLNMISPGLVFFYAGFAIVLAQGLISMISAAAVYSIRGVPCFDTNIRLGSFIFCTIGFFVPFLNLLPWTAMWVAAIIWSHR